MGYGIVDKVKSRYIPVCYGCIETPPAMAIPQRLEMLYNGLREQIENCSPSFMSVEKLFFGRNTTTAENVWQARGVVMLIAAQNSLSVVEPKPSEAKMTVCGNGRADKRQVQGMVQILLNLKEIPRPDDAADALAIAMAGLALFSSPGAF